MKMRNNISKEVKIMTNFLSGKLIYSFFYLAYILTERLLIFGIQQQTGNEKI